MDLLIAYWPLAFVAALVAIALLYLLLRPRQRVSLTDSGPVRPHMTAATSAAKVSAPSSPDTTPASTSAALHDAAGPADDLTKLKGIGPKLAALLNSHGLTRFDQIASLSPSQIERLDEGLGAFRGRLIRDQVAVQADYLARGDVDGFEQKYGKL